MEESLEDIVLEAFRSRKAYTKPQPDRTPREFGKQQARMQKAVQRLWDRGEKMYKERETKK